MPPGLLGSVTPAAQVLPDGSFRQVDAELLADQVTNGAAGPQGMRNAQLLRGVVVNAPLDALGLGVGQGTARAERPAGAAAGQRRQAVSGVGGPPAADGLVANAQQVSEVQLGVAQLEAAQGAQAQHLKCFIGKMAGIW
jgi:hypothetical protein